MEQETNQTPDGARKFMRDTEDAWISGVCSGLAKHWNTDPMLVRVLTIAISLAIGIVPLIYVLLGFFTPAAPLESGKVSQERRWLLWLLLLLTLFPIFAILTLIAAVVTNVLLFQVF